MKKILSMMVLVLMGILAAASGLAVNPSITSNVCTPASCSFPENDTVVLALSVNNPDDVNVDYAFQITPPGVYQIQQFISKTNTGAVFHFRPGFDSSNVNRPFSIQITLINVSNGQTLDVDTKNVAAINVNRPPVIGQIPNQNLQVNSTFTFTVGKSDPDGDTMIFSDNTGLFDINPTTGLIQYTARNEDIGTHEVVITLTDQFGATAERTFTITVAQQKRLIIRDVTVYVGDDDEDIDNGDEFDASPGDTLKFEVEVENLFSGSGSEDVDIEDVKITITIEDWDDDDDERESSKRFTVKADKRKKETIDFGKIPLDIEDGDHDIIITVTGEHEDDSNIIFEDTIIVTMNIDKEDEDLRFSSIDINPQAISCERQVTISFTLENIGTDDADDDGVWVTFENRDLGIAIIALQDHELDEGKTVRKSVPVTIADSVRPGSYPITVKAYFDRDEYQRGNELEEETLFLVVDSCGPQASPTPSVIPTPKPEVIVVTPSPTPVIPVTTPVATVSTGALGSSWVIAALIAGIVIVVVVIIFLLVKLAK